MDQEKFDKIIKLVCKEMELQNAMSHKFVEETLNAIAVFDKKHTEKGLSSYGEFGPIGVMVKMAEKFNTLKEYYTVMVNSADEEKLTSEELEKLWQDVSVYALMGKLVEEGEWCEPGRSS